MDHQHQYSHNYHQKYQQQQPELGISQIMGIQRGGNATYEVFNDTKSFTDRNSKWVNQHHLKKMHVQ